ncbi:MAG: TnpV protein [Lachnospiraceae bacterium]
MKQKQEMTEQLKAINPINWTQLMNCIRQQVNEIIFAELIFN